LKGYSLPFTATVAAAVVTLTARHKGVYATGLDIYIPVLESVNAFSGVLTFATTTPGAGVGSIANVLAAMNDDPFEIITSAFGDAANLILAMRLFSMRLVRALVICQQIYGHYFYPKVDTSSNLATFALARDNWHLTMIAMFSAAASERRIICGSRHMSAASPHGWWWRERRRLA
jgi:phage tail sheath gpL-like